jgi:hypothetical protein
MTDPVQPAVASPEARSRSLPSQVLEDGFFCGVLGAGLVAVWYLLLDLIAGRPFFTPALLGSIMFGGVRDATAVVIGPRIVAWYTAAHFFAFLVIGVISAWLAAQFDRFPAVGIAMLFLFVLFETAFFIFAFSVGSHVLGTLGLWTVAVANLLAAAGMAGYLYWRHPSAMKNMGRIWEDGGD